ncbi:MAG: hypothetical protein A2283_17750 [Lentisphaerae bacterium RIFOXYA12_FULL_48_11]|nr:MAG: hypothetical protein A2283_17750 [Lentisphaerae bacterium RIFOXYA12_FULL_48_11]
MIRYTIGICVFVVSLVWNVSAETFALQDKSCQRKLRIVRHYEVVAQQGKPTVAALPALMSFWGETNWQLVKSSRFTYSEQPDKTDITADNRGQPRRYYQMTWNAPKAGKITVEQIMDVELTCFNTLYTAAKLPYADGALKRFSSSLGADEKEGINPNNPDLKPICDLIVKRSRNAEEVVEGVCDWINDNIKFVKGQKSSDEALAQRQGSCTPMSRLACSMLRRIGIPAEMVDAKFIGKDSGHAFIEVYFQDAGWIFYDLSNWNRGYKSLDCLMTVGWAYLSGTPEKTDWIDGYFCVEKDAASYSDRSETGSRLIRRSPQGKKVTSAIVVAQKAPLSAKPRQRPLKELILDKSIPPGQREYSDNVLGSTETATEPGLPGK